MKITCPNCNTLLSLESLAEDASARELFGVLSNSGPLAGALVSYLTLFKPARQALRWSRAISLVRELQEDTKEVNEAILNRALVNTVETLCARRQQPDWKPLTNHRYLLSVLQTEASRPAVNVDLTGTQTAIKSTPGTSKTSQALAILESLKTEALSVPQWFAAEIADGLSKLVTMSLKRQPPADTIRLTANSWMESLGKKEWEQQIDTPRIRSAFHKISLGAEDWPTSKQFLEQLPPRKKQPDVETVPVDTGKWKEFQGQISEACKGGGHG